MNMGFPGCLLLAAGHPLGRSSAACAGAGNTRIPILLAWLWAFMTGFPMTDSGIPELTQLRLVNGSSRCAGRIEVLHNQQWGTVCDDGWDLAEARVMCRQLGCGTALSGPGGARFGQGSDRIWLDDVNCAGTEAALSSCRARPWGTNDCTHGEDAGVVCSDAGISEAAPLRLVNGSSRCAGRVEVLHNQVWGTVCDDSWDITDAGVVCRQLGCGTASSASGGARFGQGSDSIWLYDVNCAGTEAALSNCRAPPWGENNCNHGEDAGVVCSDSGNSEVAPLRLVNGSSRCAGRVEVLHNQQWGTVCDDSWDKTDAGVVCRQLGCGTALSAPGGAPFGRGSDPIWLDEVNCAGKEAALSDCRARPWGTNDCSHGEDAGVVCSGAANEEFHKGVLQVTEEQTQHPWASMTGFPMTGAANEEFHKGVLQVTEEQTQHPWDSTTGFPMTGAANEEFRKGVLQVTEEQTQHPWGLENNTILAITIPVSVGVILALVLPLVYYLKKKKKVVTNRRKERVQNLYGKNNNPTEDQYTDNKGVAYSHGMGEEAPEPIYENFVLEDVPCSTHHSEQKCESAFPLYVNGVYRP